MTTARDFIRRTLQLIGVVGEGEAMTASEANDALSAFNEMADTWSIMGPPIFTETRESFALTGATSYTIGSGGDFNTVRPIRIVKAFVTQGDLSYALDIEDQLSYADIHDKTLTGRPGCLYYDANYPLGNIFLHPIPSSSYTLNLYSEKPLTGPATLDTVLAFPPGYQRAFRYNLAIDVAPEYDRAVSEDIKRIARSSLQAIKNANRMNDENKLRVDNALLRMSKPGYYDADQG